MNSDQVQHRNTDRMSKLIDDLPVAAAPANPSLALGGWAAVCLFGLLTEDQVPDLHAEVSLPIEAWRDILNRVGYGKAQEELERQILGIPGVEREDSGAMALRMIDGQT